MLKAGVFRWLDSPGRSFLHLEWCFTSHLVSFCCLAVVPHALFLLMLVFLLTLGF